MIKVPFFTKDHVVQPNETGFIYRDGVLLKSCGPGRHRVWDHEGSSVCHVVPTSEIFHLVPTQEVLTKDSVGLRASSLVRYVIADSTRFMGCFALRGTAQMLFDLQCQVHGMVQIRLRELVATLGSVEIMDKRLEFKDIADDELKAKGARLGVEFIEVSFVDLTFPKSVQELFTRQLETRLRSQSDLETARTTVATARALKNAAELIKGDSDIRFIQYLDTISKIASKGKHTFHIAGLAHTGDKSGD